ncbi:phosphoglycerate kinase [uncultured Peptoniphilus sp.]|uniref:phosphoglycerate kinase n=1 Tax=uncultured Peptoniphilus sp. TaxID=254354 RepID=UPI002803F856|nr:phosphoglycerate kinase [uncultured Peptoniphilus sp.]
MIKNLKDYDFKNKTALVRVDFNVPLKNGKVAGDDRIVKSLPTIKYLKDAGAKIILMSHLGRPKGKYNKDLSLKAVAQRLGKLLGEDILFLEDQRVVSDDLKERAKSLKEGQIALLENLRFVPEEEKNDPDFAKNLASLADVYINDAFGTAHRAHASNSEVTKHLPSFPGFLLEKEIKYLKDSLENPERPFVAILGGSKVSDKIELIKNLLNKVDKLIIVGAMAINFLKAEGIEVGTSLVEEDKLDLARKLISLSKDKKVKLILPLDVVTAKEISEEAQSAVFEIHKIPKDQMILDIGPKTLENLKEELKDANTVVWNGPCGVFEIEQFAKGTMGLAKILGEIKGLTIVGGGDSVSAVEKSGLAEKFTHISTGGGASLELLEGKELPALKALGDSEK